MTIYLRFSFFFRANTIWNIYFVEDVINKMLRS